MATERKRTRLPIRPIPVARPPVLAPQVQTVRYFSSYQQRRDIRAPCRGRQISRKLPLDDYRHGPAPGFESAICA